MDVFSSHLWHNLQYKIQVFSWLWRVTFLWKFRLLSYCNLCTLSLLSLPLGTPCSYCHRHTPLKHPQSSFHSIPLASCLHPLNHGNGNTPIGCHVFQNSIYNLFEFQRQHYHFSAHLGISRSLFCLSAPSSVIHCYKMSWRHNPGLQGSRTKTRCCLCMSCLRDACLKFMTGLATGDMHLLFTQQFMHCWASYKVCISCNYWWSIYLKF